MSSQQVNQISAIIALVLIVILFVLVSRGVIDTLLAIILTLVIGAGVRFLRGTLGSR